MSIKISIVVNIIYFVLHISELSLCSHPPLTMLSLQFLNTSTIFTLSSCFNTNIFSHKSNVIQTVIIVIYSKTPIILNTTSIFSSKKTAYLKITVIFVVLKH